MKTAIDNTHPITVIGNNSSAVIIAGISAENAIFNFRMSVIAVDPTAVSGSTKVSIII